ncbi:MAG: dihydrofolate reductase family protein [Bacteroidales bacterium]
MDDSPVIIKIQSLHTNLRRRLHQDQSKAVRKDVTEDNMSVFHICHTNGLSVIHRSYFRQETAVLLTNLGDRTAFNDDPGLDARLWAGSSPRRFVLSELPELPGDLKIFKGEPRTVIFSRGNTKKEAGAEYHKINSRDKTLEEVLDYMYKREILSVIIEGGYLVLSQFIEAGLWDEARIFKGEMVFRAGLKAPLLEGVVTGRQDFPSSRLEYWRPYD